MCHLAILMRTRVSSGEATDAVVLTSDGDMCHLAMLRQTRVVSASFRSTGDAHAPSSSSVRLGSLLFLKVFIVFWKNIFFFSPRHHRFAQRTASSPSLQLLVLPPYPHSTLLSPVLPSTPPLRTTRDVAAGAPRDRSIALIAPAAAALCLALPRSGGSGGGPGSSNSVRATLYGVLAGCMGGALDLMAMVLDGASRLGLVVSADK